MSADPASYVDGSQSNDLHVSNRNMEFLRTKNTSDMTIATLDGGLLSASRFTRGSWGHGVSDEHIQEDAFMLAYQLRDYEGGLWVDGKQVDFKGSKANNFTFYDYSRVWRADLQSPFECVNFHISRAALRSLEDDLGTRRIDTFNIPPGADVSDPVVRGIVDALIPIFDGQQHTSELVLDYVRTGLLVHLATTYGANRTVPTIRRGGLTPFQMNRATALLDANLAAKLTLSDFARECVLSTSYFAKAFKVTTGISLFKWIANRRIEKATELLRSTSLSLTDIANKCGFADQAHFTRAFRDAKGVTPAAWKRERQYKLMSVYGFGKFLNNV